MPKGATVSDTLNKSTAYAQKAEELGFNRFWLAEHHNMPGIVRKPPLSARKGARIWPSGATLPMGRNGYGSSRRGKSPNT